MTDQPKAPSAVEVARIWREKENEFQETRRRVQEVRAWLAGKVDPVVPKDFPEATRMAIKTPHATTLALHTVQVLSRKRPRLRRDPIGTTRGTASIAARRKASELELWVNAVIASLEEQHGKVWRPLVDFLFNQSCCAVLVFPKAAAWEDFPPFKDDAGEINVRYQRDGGGYDRGSPSRKGAFRVSKRSSNAAYGDYLQDYKARQIPMAVRCIGPDQALPIFGPNFRLDGLIVRGEYTREALEERGYRWLFGSEHIGVGRDPDEASRALWPRFTLVELWQPGRVCYYVMKGATPLPDGGNVTAASYQDGSPAVVDLANDFGIGCLPGGWFWGAHLASEPDPDLRGVPFLWPFLSSFAGVNNLATAKLGHSWQHSFGGWFLKYDKDAPDSLVFDKGKPRAMKVRPMQAQYVGGEPIPAVHPGTNKDVDELTTLLLGSVREEGTNAAALGGAGAESGHDRSLIRAMLEDAQSDVLSGGLEAWAMIGRLVTEIGTAIADKYKTPVPVYVAVQPKGGPRVRQALELDAELADGVFDFTAEYPPAEGENLPYAQMLMEWSIQRRIPLRQALEKGMADETPDETMIEILVEDMLFNTQEGRGYIYQIASEELGDDRMAELFKQVQAGNAMPDGTPAAAMQGLGQGQLTGTSVPNAVQSAVAGIVGGATEAGPMRQDALATMAAGAGRPALNSGG